MARFRSNKNSLIAGQISPTAMGRTDLPQYPSACAQLFNMIPMTVGGAYRRPGSLFDHSFAAATYSYPRLIPFVVSQEEPYVLALYRALAGSGIIDAYRPTDTFVPSTKGTVTGGTTYGYDSTTGMEEADQVQFAQSVDVMTLVHPNHKPLRVRRTATDTFIVSSFDTDKTGTRLTDSAFREAWPYMAENASAITLSINTATVGTGRTLTASAALFNSKHVGAVFKVNNGSSTGCALVTAYTSSTVVTVEVIVAFGAAATPSAVWWESAWSDYRGWPRSVAFFQNRIAYGGNATFRDSIWFSTSFNFDAMSDPAIEDPTRPGDGTTGPKGLQPFTAQLSSQQLNVIQWLSPGVTLVAGTLGQEIVLTTTSQGFGSIGTDGFGADTVIAVTQTYYGSAYHQVARIGSELIFANQADDAVRSLIFNLLEDSYTSEPVQTLFDEYPKPNPSTKRRHFRLFSWDESRKTLWCVDTAGNLFGMTRDRTLQVTAWHTHQMGGYDTAHTGSTPIAGLVAGSVVSVAVIPNPSLKVNDVWLTVFRHVNGADYYHVERFIGKNVSADTIDTPFLSNSGNYFVDACVYNANGFETGILPEGYSYPAAHLEGVALSGTADKIGGRGIFTIKTAAVSSGSAVLSSPYPPDFLTVGYNFAIGLPFSSIVQPVRIEAGSQIGSAQGAIKRIHKAIVRIYKTLSAKIGASSDSLETIIFRTGETPMNESPEFFTGDKIIDIDGDYDRDGYLYLVQDQPLPFSVMSIIAEGQTYDGG